MIPLPAWWRVAKIALPVLAVALLLGALLYTKATLRRTLVERDAAVADVTTFRRLVTDATVPADAEGDRALLSTVDAQAAAVAVFRDRDDARAALTRIDRDTRAARTRSVASDAALARTQAGMARTYAREVAPRVAKLDAAPPVQDDAAEAAAIGRDSLEAWK